MTPEEELNETVTRLIDVLDGKEIIFATKALAITASEVISSGKDAEEKNMMQIFVTKIIQSSIHHPI